MRKSCLLYFCVVCLASVSPLIAQQQDSFTEIQKTVRTGRLDVAVNMLNKYIRQNPDSIKAYLLLGRVHLAIGGPNNKTAAEKAFLEGLRHDPNNVDLLKRLASVKENQQMVELSTHWLEKAIKIDPNDQQMIDKLLESYIQAGAKKKVEKLRSLVDEALKKNPDSSQSYLTKGKMEITLNQADKAIPLLEKGLELDPKNPDIIRQLSDAYLWTGNGDKFQEYYFRWLATENDFSTLSKEYEIATLAMADDEIIKFNKVSFSEKGKYLINYWRGQDPYPVTFPNERLIEHIWRVMYSRVAFHTIEGNLSFDDRGKVFIRWGQPDEHFSDPSMELIGDGIGHGIKQSNESWYYPSIGLFMAFDFVSYGGYYHEVPTLVDAIPGGQGLNIAQGLYKQRDFMGGIYTQIANRTGESFQSDLLSFRNDIMSARRNTKPRYKLALDMPKLEFTYRTAQFRGDSGRTRVELAYGIPLEQLGTLPEEDSTFAYIFENDIVLIDSASRRNLHVKGHQRFLCPTGFDYSRITYLNEEYNAVFPGPYKMTFQLIEMTNKKGDFTSKPLIVRNFSGDSLMTSDLKFSQQIDVSGVDSLTGAEKLSVMPYPFSFVNQKKPINLYFEIYNLLLKPEKGSRYRISLNVARERKKGEYVTMPLQTLGKIFSGGKSQTIETTYEREGNSMTAHERILLDFSGLESGHSRLTVTVEDLNARQSVQSNIEFNLKK